MLREWACGQPESFAAFFISGRVGAEIVFYGFLRRCLLSVLLFVLESRGSCCPFSGPRIGLTLCSLETLFFDLPLALSFNFGFFEYAVDGIHMLYSFGMSKLLVFRI